MTTTLARRFSDDSFFIGVFTFLSLISKLSGFAALNHMVLNSVASLVGGLLKLSHFGVSFSDNEDDSSGGHFSAGLAEN